MVIARGRVGAWARGREARGRFGVWARKHGGASVRRRAGSWALHRRLAFSVRSGGAVAWVEPGTVC